MNLDITEIKFEEVKKIIFEAFKDIKKGNGIGMWEGGAIDSYKSKEEQEIARAKDGDQNWFDLKEEWDFQISTAMCFTDKEGFRFLFPALMYTEEGTMVFSKLNVCVDTHQDLVQTGPNSSSPLYLDFLKKVSPTEVSKYYSFNKAQIHAIAVFLKWWMLSDDFFMSGSDQNSPVYIEELRILNEWIALGVV